MPGTKGASGRPGKLLLSKRVGGSFRARDAVGEATAETLTRLEPPESLTSDRARQFFEVYATQLYWSRQSVAGDDALLAQGCNFLAEAEAAQAKLAAAREADDIKAARTWMMNASDANKRANSILGQMRLSPANRDLRLDGEGAAEAKAGSSEFHQQLELIRGDKWDDGEKRA